MCSIFMLTLIHSNRPFGPTNVSFLPLWDMFMVWSSPSRPLTWSPWRCVMRIAISLFMPRPYSTKLLWVPSPQSMRTTSPSRLMATAGRFLPFVGVAELVPRKTTSSPVTPRSPS
jgi:hypothetical protein